MRAHISPFLADLDGVVVTYRALLDEVDVGELGTALPRLEGDNRMTIRLVATRLERHSLGFDQPPAESQEIEAKMLAAILVPGMAFDRSGTRLGRGGGHYDRLLGGIAEIPFVGIATENRVIDELPRAAHDVPMTHLATETGLREVRYGPRS